MQELIRRLLAEIGPGRRYASARDLSKRLGNVNLVQGWIDRPQGQEPRLSTLYALSQELGWRYCDVVCWALGIPPEAGLAEDAENTVMRGLEAMEVPVEGRPLIVRTARQWAAMGRSGGSGTGSAPPTNASHRPNNAT